MVTADVDAFPMSSQIIEPIFSPIHMSIWLYQYSHTAKTAETFAMSFIAAKSHIWRKLLNYEVKDLSDIGKGLNNWIETQNTYFANRKDLNKNRWWVDQTIISRAILANGLCSLPAENKLWNAISLADHQPK